MRLITKAFVASFVAVLAAMARAEDFFFTPACGENTGLFACCLVDPPGGVGCLFDEDGDPIAFLHTNNWGEIGACGACPGANQYPGPGDCIFLGNNIGTISGGVPLVFDCVVANLDAGGGLNLSNVSLSTTNAFSASNLTLSVATVSSGGVFTVSNLNWLVTGTSGLTAQEFCLGDALLAGAIQHTFNDGNVKNSGTVTWTNGQIGLDGGDWTNFGTFKIEEALPQTGRFFHGGAFNNFGTICTLNNDPAAGQVTFDFNSNAPVFTTGTGTFVVGEGTRLRLMGAGSISPGSGAPASHVGTGGIFQLGGSLTSFILDDGTNILDDSPDGSGRVQFFNVEVPAGADVFIQSAISQDNSLNVFGQLGIDDLNITGSSINGGGTGSLAVENLLTSGFLAKDFNDLDVLVSGTASITVGFELDNATLTIGDGFVPGATAEFTDNDNFTATFRVDVATDTSTLAVAPNSQVLFTAPTSTTFTRIGPGQASVSVGGTLQVQSPQTTVNANIGWFVFGSDGTVRVAPCPEEDGACPSVLTVFSPFALDAQATLAVDERNTFHYRGPSFTATNSLIDILGTFQTFANQDNPITVSGTQVQVGAAGQLILNDDTVTLAGASLSNGGTVQFNDCAALLDYATYVAETGSETNVSDGTATLSGSYELQSGSSLTASNAAVVNVGSTDGQSPATVAAELSASVAATSGASVCVQPGSTITGAGRIEVLGQSQFCTQDAEVVAEELDVDTGGSATQSGGSVDLSRLEVDTTALLNLNDLAMQNIAKAVFKGDLTIEGNSSLTVDAFFATLFGAVAVDPQDEAPGSTVNVTGSLSFEMTDETHWAWGINSKLALTGGINASVGLWQNFTSVEIGGADLGNVPAGFDNNFDVSNLVIGPGAHAYIEDVIDNGNRGPSGAPEALYVGTLTFADPAGVLNVNGLNLYVGQLVGSPGQIINVPIISTPGDIDGDGDVDTADVATLINCFGQVVETGDDCADADINGDGVINLADIELVALNLTGPQLPGACCLPDTTCLTQVQTQCEALGGMFQGSGTSCANVVCPLPPQPCCLADGPCTLLTPLVCIANGGTTLPSGTTCDETTCANAGPCCSPNGNCVVQSAADCAEAGGLFQGFGQSCQDAVCFVEKACCLPGELPCVVTDVNLCLSVGGTPINSALSCEEVDCDTQACCLDSGCQDLLASECIAAGGTPQGSNTSCAGGFGPTCPATGACDLPDGSCTATTAEDCAGQGGVFGGDGTVCPPLGACCSLTLATCAVQTEQVCESGGGTYLGDGTSCDGVQACVLANGTCADLAVCTCLAVGGEPQGPGTTCASFGACCLTELGGLCTLTNGPDPCTAIGGLFMGAGTTCTDPGCGLPAVGGCCFGDGSCEVVSNDVCTFAGGVYLGDNVSCAGAPCGVGACCDPASGLPCEEVPLFDCGSLAAFKGAGTSCETVNCDPGGACCAVNGTCMDVAAPEQCAGTYLGDGTSCASNPCGDGACCLVSGGCAETNLVGCLFLGGTFQGPNSICAEIQCPQPPEGACCLPDGDCIILDVQTCTNNSGVYLGDGTTCENAPCGAGACCHDDGLCMLSTHAVCVIAGGAFQGTGTNCAQVNCPPPFGACCFGDGTCQMFSPGQCAGAGGTYLGNGTICDPDNPCGQGACCFADGSCMETTLVLCTQIGGGFPGAGTACDTAACPQPPTGACCLASPGAPGCVQVEAELCALAGGEYQGDSVPCVPSPCEPGACCLPDGTCQLLRLLECLEVGGLFHGPGTDCPEGGGAMCPPGVGACCLNDGSCLLVPNQDLVPPQEYCTLFLGGVFQGLGSTCMPNPCRQGDLDGDDDADLADILLFMNCFGEMVTPGDACFSADIDDSGVVNLSDIVELTMTGPE